MGSVLLLLVALASALALIRLGGGLYEFSVVDPAWPRRLDLIQPARGGISRKRFWIPAHTTFELVLIGAVIVGWSLPDVRAWLLIALAVHGVMRVWSAFDFITKALAFERGEVGPDAEVAALRWVRRSRLRFPMDVASCSALVIALAKLTHVA